MGNIKLLPVVLDCIHAGAATADVLVKTFRENYFELQNQNTLEDKLILKRTF
jgi:hypothetical protein